MGLESGAHLNTYTSSHVHTRQANSTCIKCFRLLSPNKQLYVCSIDINIGQSGTPYFWVLQSHSLPSKDSLEELAHSPCHIADKLNNSWGQNH